MFNLYKLFRTFGYRVRAIGDPKTFFLKDNISKTALIPRYSQRFLSANDLGLGYLDREEEDTETKTGLEAIFKQNETIQPNPIREDDFENLYQFNNVLVDQNHLIDWHGAELFLLQNQKDMNSPEFLYALGNSFKALKRRRFLVHAHLNLDQTRIPIQFILKAMKHKISLLRSKRLLKANARKLMLNYLLSQIEQELRSQKIYHRTLIGVVFEDPKTKAKRFYLSVPGLKAKPKVSSKPVDVAFVQNTFMRLTGLQVPEEAKETFENLGSFDHLNNREDHNHFEKIQPYRKYMMFFYPSKDSVCDSILWKSAFGKIAGLSATQPIVEVIKKKDLVIYPCSISEPTVLSWFEATPHQDMLGKFYLKSQDDMIFLLGKNYIRYDHPFLNLFPAQDLKVFLLPPFYQNIQELKRRVDQDVLKLKRIHPSIQNKSVAILFSEAL